MGGQEGIRIALFCALVAETVMILPSPSDILLPLAFLSFALLRFDGLTAWDKALSKPDPAQAASFALVPLMLIVALRLYKLVLAKASERGDLVDRLKRSSLDLIDTNIALQEQIVHQEARLLLIERSRISRELHDTIGYTLMNILAMQKAAGAIIGKDPERAREFILKTMEQSERGLRDTRAAIGSLRGHEYREATIAEAVTRLAKAFENTHIRISANLNNSAPTYGTEVDDALGHFVQEAITNAIKHGNADEIILSFWRTTEGVTVTVRDNGSGTKENAKPSEGIGLKGMRERFGALGGRIAMANAYSGFWISAFVPADACKV
ncbi:MAG: sensor histidine kinase [Spirochaetaceae bacterium]|nr:sensor histidine kinase [Spirochaetaceae bacterium]